MNQLLSGLHFGSLLWRRADEGQECEHPSYLCIGYVLTSMGSDADIRITHNPANTTLLYLFRPCKYGVSGCVIVRSSKRSISTTLNAFESHSKSLPMSLRNLNWSYRSPHHVEASTADGFWRSTTGVVWNSSREWHLVLFKIAQVPIEYARQIFRPARCLTTIKIGTANLTLRLL